MSVQNAASEEAEAGSAHEDGSASPIRAALAAIGEYGDGTDEGYWKEALAVGALGVGLLADLGSTAAGLQLGLVETNPVGAALLAAAGLPPLLAVKAGMSALLVAQVAVYRRRWGELAGGVALSGSLLTAGLWVFAAGWNTALIAARAGWSA